MDHSPQGRPEIGPQNDVPSVARATLPPGDSSIPGETGAQFVVSGLRTNPRLANKVLREIENAVEATRPVWDSSKKSFIEKPDFKTRLAACELFLSYCVGLPVQRNENLNITAPNTAAVGYEEMLRKSPALRQAMRRSVDRAEAEAKVENDLRKTGAVQKPS